MQKDYNHIGPQFKTMASERKDSIGCDLNNSESSNGCPRRLQCLASDVEYLKGNRLLHQFVLDNSYPNRSGSEVYMNGIMLSFCDSSANVLNDEGYSALHLAVLKKNVLMLKKLLSCVKNIDVNMESAEGRNTALHLAASLSESPIAQELLEDGNKDDVETDSEEPICNLDIAKLLLENGADVDAENEGVETPLIIAAKFGNLELISLLCDKGANASAALLYQTILCNYDVVNLLLDKDADVNTSDNRGVTPLHVAAEWCPLEVLKMLLDRGADVNARDVFLDTPLHLAVNERDFDIIKILVHGGANVNSGDRNGLTPFLHSVEHRGMEVVQFLVDSGANVQTVRHDGEAVLHSETVLCHTDRIEFLAHKGADVNARDKSGCTPLHRAAKLSDRDLKYGSFVLPISPFLCVSDIISLLIDLGADVNPQDRIGNTPLHYACEIGDENWEAVKLLVDKGASVYIPNSSGEISYEIAYRKDMFLPWQ